MKLIIRISDFNYFAQISGLESRLETKIGRKVVRVHEINVIRCWVFRIIRVIGRLGENRTSPCARSTKLRKKISRFSFRSSFKRENNRYARNSSHSLDNNWRSPCQDPRQQALVGLLFPLEHNKALELLVCTRCDELCPGSPNYHKKTAFYPLFSIFFSFNLLNDWNKNEVSKNKKKCSRASFSSFRISIERIKKKLEKQKSCRDTRWLTVTWITRQKNGKEKSKEIEILEVKLTLHSVGHLGSWPMASSPFCASPWKPSLDSRYFKILEVIGNMESTSRLENPRRFWRHCVVSTLPTKCEKFWFKNRFKDYNLWEILRLFRQLLIDRDDI